MNEKENRSAIRDCATALKKLWRHCDKKYKMESIPPRRSGCAISKALPGLRGDRDAEGQAYLSFVSFEAFACQIAGLSEMWKRSLE